MVHPKHHYYIAIVILLGVIILFTLLFLSIMNQKSEKSKLIIDNANTYKSEILDISIVIPNGFSAEEKFGTIKVKDDNGEEIVISGIGTNFEDLDSYVDDIVNTNNSTITHKENLMLNGLPVVRATINGRRYYLIYTKNWIYTFQAVSPDLYDDLDQIAQSFKYLPPDGEAD